METRELPPVQQAYFKKRGQPTTYVAPRPGGSSSSPGAGASSSQYPEATPLYSRNDPAPVYSMPLGGKVAVVGTSYFKTIAFIQTLLLLGIFCCLAAMAAKAYDTPDISSSRF